MSTATPVTDGSDQPGSLPEYDLPAWWRDEQIETVLVGGCDGYGVWRGKRMPAAEFLGSGSRGVLFCEVLLTIAHDEGRSGEGLVEPPGGASFPTYFPRKEHGYRDMVFRPDMKSLRHLPWQDRTAAVLGDFFSPSGEEIPVIPRAVLRQQVRHAERLGFEVRCAGEYEFYVLDPTRRDDGGSCPPPISARSYTYGATRASLDEKIVGEIRRNLIKAGIDVEASHCETGPGHYEVTVGHADALRAADDAFVYKSAVKEVVAEMGLTATFMAKPRDEWPGSSCHVHQSLWREDRNVMFDPSAEGGFSRTGRHYVAGQLATIRDFMPIFCPNPNSYKRLSAYSWAPTTATWSWANRGTLLRALVGGERGTRVEHRMPAADVNPYLACAAMIAGGLYGIEHELEPPAPFDGDAYGKDGISQPSLSFTLDEALSELRSSSLARDLLGRDFVEYFIVLAEHEAAMGRTHVTDWEVNRYLEMA